MNKSTVEDKINLMWFCGECRTWKSSPWDGGSFALDDLSELSKSLNCSGTQYNEDHGFCCVILPGMFSGQMM